MPAAPSFPFSGCARFLLMLGLGVLAAVSSFAAPFAQKVPFTQPDGTQIELWGEGDEFHAVFESLEGYTVVFDPATKTYYYALMPPAMTRVGCDASVTSAARDNRPPFPAVAANRRIM